jgi:hypothetical protein
MWEIIGNFAIMAVWSYGMFRWGYQFGYDKAIKDKEKF